MRDPTSRELLLQNLLARSTVLIFQTAKALERSVDPHHQTLVIECQNWFSEARQSISAGIRSEAPPAGMPSPAPIAVLHRVRWGNYSQPDTWKNVEKLPDGLLRHESLMLAREILKGTP